MASLSFSTFIATCSGTTFAGVGAAGSVDGRADVEGVDVPGSAVAGSADTEGGV